jgi:6-phosphogluconolactonase
MRGLGFHMYQFGSAQALAEAVAQDWCWRIEQIKKPFTVALSGGRIAKDLFRELALKGRGNKGLRNARFVWADERCVPPEHAESNYRVARELLFDPLAIEASHVYRIHGEDDPPRAAAAASRELLQLAMPEEAPVPRLDWVFLGMGEDGHVASLFPDATPYRGIYYDVIAPKPPSHRISLSYDVLAAAREVWVLASGKGKEEALRESISQEGNTPLARVIKSRHFTQLFSDILPQAA